LEQDVIPPDTNGCHARLEPPAIGIDLYVVRHVSGPSSSLSYEGTVASVMAHDEDGHVQCDVKEA
jgi:hypothetical protein